MPHKTITTKTDSPSLSTLYSSPELAPLYDPILDLIRAAEYIDENNKSLEFEIFQQVQKAKQLLHHMELSKTQSNQTLIQIASAITANVQACIDIGLNLSKLGQPALAKTFYELSLDFRGCKILFLYRFGLI